MIIVHTLGEDDVVMSHRMRREIWRAFKDGGSSHSAMARTLGWLLRECERTRTPYVLSAQPGVGYYMEPLKNSNSSG